MKIALLIFIGIVLLFIIVIILFALIFGKDCICQEVKR